MSEMTPEKLRARMSCGAAILPGGGDVYATWEEFCEVQQVGLVAASAWEADRQGRQITERAMDNLAHKLTASEARLEALEALATYGEKQMQREYNAEAGVEAIMSSLGKIPSAHRSFEAFKAEKLAALAASCPTCGDCGRICSHPPEGKLAICWSCIAPIVLHLQRRKHEAEDKMAVELSKIKNDFEAETGLSVSDLYVDFSETTTMGDKDCRYIISSVHIATDDIGIT